MGMLGKLVSGIAGTPAYRLCRAAGLPIEESDRESTTLCFDGDHISPRRPLFVSDLDHNLTMFAAYVRERIPEGGLSHQLLLELLSRRRWAGTWSARRCDDGVRLGIQYNALTKGLDVEMCSVICHTMIREVAEIEARLAAYGLLP